MAFLRTLRELEGRGIRGMRFNQQVAGLKQLRLLRRGTQDAGCLGTPAVLPHATRWLVRLAATRSSLYTYAAMWKKVDYYAILT